MLGCARLFCWVAVGRTGLYWTMLGCCVGLRWAALGCAGLCWAAGRCWAVLQALLDCAGVAPGGGGSSVIH